MLDLRKRSVTPEILSKSITLQHEVYEGAPALENKTTKNNWISDFADETTEVSYYSQLMLLCIGRFQIYFKNKK